MSVAISNHLDSNDVITRSVQSFRCYSLFLPEYYREFAVAMHRALGWNIIGVRHEGKFIHTFVEDLESGVALNAGGKVHGDNLREQIIKHLEVDFTELSFEELSVEDVEEDTAIFREMVNYAQELAEVLWPWLPWKKPRFPGTVEFLTELDALCQKHHVQLKPESGKVLILPASTPKQIRFTLTSEKGHYAF